MTGSRTLVSDVLSLQHLALDSPKFWTLRPRVAAVVPVGSEAVRAVDATSEPRTPGCEPPLEWASPGSAAPAAERCDPATGPPAARTTGLPADDPGAREHDGGVGRRPDTGYL